MAINSLVQPLTRIELFQALSAEQLQKISSRADRIVYKPGDVIVTANTEADGAILIVTGEASRISGPGVGDVAEPIPAGSLLIEMAMMIETEAQSTIVARSTIRALRIARSDMLELMGADPSIADHFIGRISSRLSEFAASLREMDKALEDSTIALIPPSAGQVQLPNAVAAPVYN